MLSLAWAVAAVALTGAGSRVCAQTSGSDASLYLVLPVGARAAGQGQTLVAEDSLGSESVWWNPAGIARQRGRELAIHHSQTVAGTGDAISFVIPSRSRGVAALSLNILDLGSQQVTDDPNQPPIGLILVRNVIYALTYAIVPLPRASVGIGYKVSQLRLDCTGQCGELPPKSETVRAFDAGAQYRVGSGHPVTLAAALRNQQSDKRARQIEVGASSALGLVERYVSDVRVKLAASVLQQSTARRTAESGGTGGAQESGRYDHDLDLRVGTTIVYQQHIFLRGGYVGGDGDATGLALGFGVTAGRLAFDIARAFDGLSADAGQPPTYFSLRFDF